ncbi:MAG: class I SAM-dependent methyltransferase, partial [Actinomycetota bacterium]|nr:class I SAM-dependent methyltransferase [Actinomycetota bacterium]
KRIIHKAIYWYVNPVEAQLQRMQAASARALNGIADQLRVMDERLETLEKERITRRLAVLEEEKLGERVSRIERTWRQASRPASESERPVDIPARKESYQSGISGNRRPRQLPVHFDYYWFESIHRGDRELIKRRLKTYVRFFDGCKNVLDIGCGWGEFLELLKEKGIGAYGIDIEGDAVQFCRENGLDAKEAEAIEYLAQLPDESLDGIMLSQVAEHLLPQELIELLGFSFSKLKYDSNIVVETPNPQCLLIFASFFYADLSHMQPIHPDTMHFLLQSTGFQDIEIEFTNPVPKEQRLLPISVPDEAGERWVVEMNRNINKLNSVIYGYMDYSAVARKA